jgi:diguanylate cyclase
VAVADVFDAITYGRPYQKPRDDAEAVDDLLEHAGTQFDPAVVMAFLRVLRSRRRQGLRLLEAV